MMGEWQILIYPHTQSILDKHNLISQSAIIRGMPLMGQVLIRRDLRDVMAYLQWLK